MGNHSGIGLGIAQSVPQGLHAKVEDWGLGIFVLGGLELRFN